MKKKFAAKEPRIFSTEDLTKNWYVVHYFDGKRKRVYGKINQLASFKERMSAAEALRAHLIATYVPKRTDGQRLLEYLEKQRGRWRTNTYENYSSKLNRFLLHLGDQELSEDTVTDFYDQLAGTVHRTTYNNYLRQIKRLCKGIGEDHLFSKLEKLNAHATPAKYFEQRHRTRLKAAIQTSDPQLWFCCQCVYYLFIRPGSELRLMRVNDFDLDRWLVRIRPEISKNGKHEYVVIPDAFKANVKAYLRHTRPSDWLFPGVFEDNNPIGENTLGTRHRKFLTELGYGMEYKLYSWKHTGAIACVEAGIHPKILQLQLRHSTLEMTDRYLRQLGIKDLGPIERLFPKI